MAGTGEVRLGSHGMVKRGGDWKGKAVKVRRVVAQRGKEWMGAERKQ